jgi:hypothetical protein
MPKQSFTLIVAGISDLTAEVTERLFQATRDDALISRCDGLVSMDFDRVAPTLPEAIAAAIRQVEGAGVGAKVLRIEDVASRPGQAERVAREVGALNSALQLSAVIEVDPTLRPVVLELLQPTP